MSISPSRRLGLLATIALGLGLLAAPPSTASAAEVAAETTPGYVFVDFERGDGVSIALYRAGSDERVVPFNTSGGRSYYKAKVRPGLYTVCWVGGTSDSLRPLLPKCLGPDRTWVLDRSQAVPLRVPSGGTVATPKVEPGDKEYGGHVGGRVVNPDGEAVKSARVCGRPVDDPEGTCSPEALTDASGIFGMSQLAVDPAALLEVSTDDGLYATTYYGDTTDPAEATVVPFARGSFRNLPPITMQERDVPILTGTIRDSAGRAIVDANVTARRLADDDSFTSRQGLKGRYELGLDPGTYELSVTARGFAKATRQLEITGDLKRDVELSTRADDVGSVSARVTFNGKPLAGATVFLRELQYEGPRLYTSVTDTDGVYTRRDIKPGKYWASMQYKDTYYSGGLEPVVDQGLRFKNRFIVEVGATTELKLDFVSNPGYIYSKVKPKLLGPAVAGSWVTAYSGTWTPSSVRFTYQWMEGFYPIPGATAAAYKPLPRQVGKRIWVKVTATDPTGVFASRTFETEKLIVQAKPVADPEPAQQQPAEVTAEPTASPAPSTAPSSSTE